MCSSFAQITNIGTVTHYNAIGWDHTNQLELAGFRVYTGPTNFQAGFTNPALSLTGFVQQFSPPNSFVTTTSNRWLGSSSINLNGWRAGYVTAISTNGLESDRSEMFLAQFRAGVPLPPHKFQLYSVLTMAATNALPTP